MAQGTTPGETGGMGLISRTVRVTPETLSRIAGSLGTTVDGATAETQKMTAAVERLNGQTWSGEAQMAYMTRIKALQEEINRYSPVLKSLATRLSAIAGEYTAASTTAETQTASLPTDIFGA